MKNNMGIVFIFSLMICSLSVTAKTTLTDRDLADLNEVALTFKELTYYFESSIPFYAALISFDQENSMNPAEITCKFCPKRSLPCGDLIVKVQAKAMEKAIGAKDFVADEVRKKMLATYHEITKLLCIGSVDDVRNLMTKIAQDETIPCEDCQRSDWQAIGVSQPLDSSMQNRMEGLDEATNIFSYWPLFIESQEKYFKNNSIDPQIKCGKCTTKLLGLSEFEGGLLGWSLKKIAENMMDHEQYENIKLLLDACLEVVSGGSLPDIINYMVRVSNETKQVCTDCLGHSDSWKRID